MKSANDIDRARNAVTNARLTPGITVDQNLLLVGMSVALCWVAETPYGTTLERLIQGENIATGKE